MPSKSVKQARFFRAVAHGFKPKGRKAPPIAVAKEYMRADMDKDRANKRKHTIAGG